VDIIEPCGFLLTDRNFRRAGLDYLDLAEMLRHPSWVQFLAHKRSTEIGECGSKPSRLVLLTTKASLPYTDFAFAPDDTLLLGRESAGVPDDVHAAVDARALIPMRPGLRSLNIAQAAAMVLGEALRQCNLFPALRHHSPEGLGAIE
jgi:tRNA (cytidine/uridine-2'-O-)-methyltransferase